MVHYDMCIISAQSLITAESICDNGRTFAHICFNQRLEGLSFGVRHNLCLYLAARKQPKHGNLLFEAPSSVILETSLASAADIGFVYLREILEPNSHHVFHVVAYSSEDEPCSLLSDTDILGELQTAYAFLVRDEDKDCIEPFVQRYVAVLEHGADRYREPLSASVALVKTLELSVAVLQFVVPLGLGVAVRTNRLSMPTLLLQELPAGLVVGKLIYEVYERLYLFHLYCAIGLLRLYTRH